MTLRERQITATADLLYGQLEVGMDPVSLILNVAHRDLVGGEGWTVEVSTGDSGADDRGHWLRCEVRLDEVEWQGMLLRLVGIAEEVRKLRRGAPDPCPWLDEVEQIAAGKPVVMDDTTGSIR